AAAGAAGRRGIKFLRRGTENQIVGGEGHLTDKVRLSLERRTGRCRAQLTHAGRMTDLDLDCQKNRTHGPDCGKGQSDEFLWRLRNRGLHYVSPENWLKSMLGPIFVRHLTCHTKTIQRRESSEGLGEATAQATRRSRSGKAQNFATAAKISHLRGLTKPLAAAPTQKRESMWAICQ